jgi:hypothetical protein
MKLNFIYDIQSELQRVLFTYSRKDFYLKYQYRPSMSAGFDLNTTDLSNLKQQIEKEINNPKVEQVKNEILLGYKTYKNQLTNLAQPFCKTLPNKVVVVISKYGVGGSYHVPNTITLNIYNQNQFQEFIHELIHCCIEEPIVKKYALTHPQKEGLVDWLILNDSFFHSIFPDYQLQAQSELPTKKLLDKISPTNNL